MSELVQALISEFERANDLVLDAIGRCSEEQWGAVCSGEQEPVGVTFHHIAYWYPVELRYIRAIAEATPLPPMPREELNAVNDEHRRQHAGCTKEEVAALLRRNVDEVVETVSGWTDEHLQRRGTYILGGASGSVADLVEWVLIGHPRMHLRSIREATGL
jgi:hypothetical protein